MFPIFVGRLIFRVVIVRSIRRVVLVSVVVDETELFQAQGGFEEKFSVLFRFAVFQKFYNVTRESLLEPSLPFSEISRFVRSMLGGNFGGWRDCMCFIG